uniref:Uncharacterized protein n=1 Tax=Vitis vinifera TaxID=29760 RepID=A5BAW9_VITVI|nr:hypothetical protein VITISV_042357 [Vitis vinifera]
MESPGCSSGSIRLSYGAPASPMHLAFYVTASPSTLPSSSPSLEANLHSSPATGTRWQRHCRQRSTEEAPHAPIKAAAAGSTLGHGHQAAAAGSTSRRRHRNMTTNTAYVAAIEAARRIGSLDQLRGPPAMPLSPPFPPSSSSELKEEHVMEGPERDEN